MSEVDEILERTEDMLRTAYMGFQQVKNLEGPDKMMGIRNVVTFGRSVTFVLQNLRGKADGFDEWYSERVEVLEDDPVCSRMNDLRTEILKEGKEGVSNYAIGSFNSSQLQKRTPAWADGIFIGDQYGGSGFYIEKADGSEVKFYQDFPDLDIEYGLYFYDIDSSREDSGVPSSNVVNDLEYYLKILAELVSDAIERFGEDY